MKLGQTAEARDLLLATCRSLREFAGVEDSLFLHALKQLRGLELSEKYYRQVVAPMLEDRFPDQLSLIAAGLVGEGSECYGYDDNISRDHDWGPSVCLWLTAEDYRLFGPELEAAVESLPKSFLGYPARNTSTLGQGRTGVLEIGAFYQRFLGIKTAPETLQQWRHIPESNLSAVTNGKVFIDILGDFTRIRNQLKAGFPEDIRKKKIAARCMTIAQSGQYNYRRITDRKELVAAHLAEAVFINAFISMVYLLNNQYQPFYKWKHRGLLELPVMGQESYHTLDRLVRIPIDEFQEKTRVIELLSWNVIEELKRQGLSEGNEDFLLDHGYRVHEKIEDAFLRSTNPWVE
jgi:hypothetical protein